MNSKIFVIFFIGLALAACDRPTKFGNDQALRRVIFKECMASLPAGPQTTKYNDWDEVVEACESVAYYQSRVCIANCPTPAAIPAVAPIL